LDYEPWDQELVKAVAECKRVGPGVCKGLSEHRSSTQGTTAMLILGPEALNTAGGLKFTMVGGLKVYAVGSLKAMYPRSKGYTTAHLPVTEAEHLDAWVKAAPVVPLEHEVGSLLRLTAF